MKLLDKFEALFVNQPNRKTDEYPRLMDRLRSVFTTAEFLKGDLQRIRPVCRCEDAIAHLEGRCTCTKSQAHQQQEEALRGKGCLVQLESLRLDVKLLVESLRRHRSELRPDEKTEELQRELDLIENFAERTGDIVEKIRNHASELGLSCSNDALQRLKESGAELDKYSTEFFWTLLKERRGTPANSSLKTEIPSQPEKN